MKLSALIQNLDAWVLSPNPDPDITSIHYRAQAVKPGGLFVAVAGLSADGHDFIPQALKNGAAAVVGQVPHSPDLPVPYVQTPDSRAALAWIAARFYGHPSQKLRLIGITGTNGKTTTSFLIESLLESAGFSPGVIGTINYRYGGQAFDNPVTTPESADLQRILAQMADAGVSHAVVEASSHAIDRDRLLGLDFDIGVFTNLSQDHLDYHRSMAEYWACKQRFFTELLPWGKKPKQAVVNMDALYGEKLLKNLPVPGITTGTNRQNMIRARFSEQGPRGIRGEIQTPPGDFAFCSPLVGGHNLENILSAVGVGIGLGIGPETIKAGIEARFCVPGRLERVEDPQGERFVFVDYAHTPEALEKVLLALGALKTRRLICVFGCGGDRDRGKRPLMGAISVNCADLAVVTSDNPRTEDPQAIIADILAGIQPTGARQYRLADIQTDPVARGYGVEPDRRQAIARAVGLARPGDIVLIAGKGHERYQIIGTQKTAFDDREEARKALNQWT